MFVGVESSCVQGRTCVFEYVCVCAEMHAAVLWAPALPCVCTQACIFLADILELNLTQALPARQALLSEPLLPEKVLVWPPQSRGCQETGNSFRGSAGGMGRSPGDREACKKRQAPKMLGVGSADRPPASQRCSTKFAGAPDPLDLSSLSGQQ